MSLYLGEQKLSPIKTSNTAQENDVNFIDYDGTILYSYAASEFLQLLTMPDNPTHKGLTSQGWNWTLSDAKTFVQNYSKLWIGQMYVTSDNKTRVYIDLKKGRLNPYIGFAVNGTVLIEWGDGISEEVTGTSTSTTIYTPHVYTHEGEYTITLSSNDNIYLSGAILSKNSSVNNENVIYKRAITKVELGDNIVLSSGSFSGCTVLKSITIPKEITKINSALASCNSLRSITIPINVTAISNFNNCYSLRSIAIPYNATSVGSFKLCDSLNSIVMPQVTVTSIYSFQQCRALTDLIIPKMWKIDSYSFLECYSLTNVISPVLHEIYGYAFQDCGTLKNIDLSVVTRIDAGAFMNNRCLTNINMPVLTTINSSIFSNCQGMSYYDFSNYTVVPTLSNINAFNNIPSDCKIIVPDDLYDDWIAATNWSTYADYIIKKTDWEEL